MLIAAVLDAVDGRVARLLKGTSRFGAELDSLADFVNFGVTPALMLYIWLLNEVKSLGWIAALAFAICAALRLARFNAALDDPDKPVWSVNFFTGVPAPAGALTVLLPIYLEFLGVLPHWPEFAPLVALYTVCIGFLMISRLPTFSGKKVGLRVRRDLVLPMFVLAVLVVALTVSYPFEMLTVGTLAYLASIPLPCAATGPTCARTRPCPRRTVTETIARRISIIWAKREATIRPEGILQVRKCTKPPFVGRGLCFSGPWAYSAALVIGTPGLLAAC
ncbi:phosphatidylcholine/phosphatidylserine synthase [Pannonibacter sp. Pt2-lr]